MLRSLFIATALATAAAGCYSEEPDVAYASATTPDLVDVSPGVQVIADYNYPVFYSDGLYWRWDNGLWYESPYYYGGWGYAYNVPLGVRGIYNPGGYAHWHGGYYGHGGYGHGGYGGYRAGGAVRDHRGGYAYHSAPGYRAAPMARGGFHGGGVVHGGGGFRGGHGGGGGHHR